jgi:hypothetical protein
VNRSIKNFIGLFLFSICSIPVCAQSGGPPMLTDDPGTVERNKWEINTSFNSSFSHVAEFEAPLIDLNYGFRERIQFKIEAPYIISRDENKKYAAQIDNPLVGIKFRFVDEGKHFVSCSMYPAAIFLIHKEDKNQVKLPLQLEKTFGKITVGQELGLLLVTNSRTNILSGTLLGIRIRQKLELMGEYYFLRTTLANTTNAYMNYGGRYKLSERTRLLASVGTQITSAADESRQYFFSFLGVQLTR